MCAGNKMGTGISMWSKCKAIEVLRFECNGWGKQKAAVGTFLEHLFVSSLFHFLSSLPDKWEWEGLPETRCLKREGGLRGRVHVHPYVGGCHLAQAPPYVPVGGGGDFFSPESNFRGLQIFSAQGSDQWQEGTVVLSSTCRFMDQSSADVGLALNRQHEYEHIIPLLISRLAWCRLVGRMAAWLCASSSCRISTAGLLWYVIDRLEFCMWG